jgi:hypothetical protein
MKNENYGYEQAEAQMRSIIKMVAALNCDYHLLEELREERDSLDEDELRNWPQAGELAELEEESNGCADADEAMQRIEEDALSIEVRSGWTELGLEFEPVEFRIVLCTGGPHVEIRGELDQYNQPSRARLKYADWGKSGEYKGEALDTDALLQYSSVFYFG